ncbi:MAG: CubicO group peptidase (beta-lactamase class C family) [Candidatus Azotimanducaceae bacterium]|jgi:CubicO group peptidase (beta-lactamase class C family)
MFKKESLGDALRELPPQPVGIAWPTESWSRADLPAASANRVNTLSDEIFELSGAQGVTFGLLIVKEGQLVHERYDAGANPFYAQYSWSMAKSVTQALTGILVADGKLDLYARAPVPEWRDDARSKITLDQLLRMSSGLAFQEDYVDGQASDVIPMLMFEGRHDTGAFAAMKPLNREPGSHWEYSSGTTNIICRILKEVVGGGASGMLKFMNDRLFEPIGIRTAAPKFDTSGTFVGSSFLMATPQDFARFGLLYLRGGVWDGTEILDRQWVDYARTLTFQSNKEAYGSHWWINPNNTNQFYCSGYDGQRILLDPDRDVIIVRVGRTPIEEVDYIWDRVFELAEKV